jgi:hypothetical protein
MAVLQTALDAAVGIEIALSDGGMGERFIAEGRGGAGGFVGGE